MSYANLTNEGRWIRAQDNPTRAFIGHTKKRVENRDVVACISGPEGYTKSTCAEHLGNIFDENFSRDHVVYTAKQYLETIRDSPEQTAIIPDEGVEIFHNRNSQKKENKIVNEVLMECRVFHHFHLCCFPRFMSVDLYLRTFRVWCWIRCTSPGRAEVRLRNWDIPVGESEEEAKRAYPIVCGVTYDPIKEEEWDRREAKKKAFVKKKISKAIA